ncbi:spore coat protein CotJB [Desulfolucanica intricata]|uniref:spore coat protein CotJB n=1 Tax=Desulfolucanica intricata TaxID=1285191 RepID=UPI0008334F73|nr:spore coat protein CotJB [Desulfolucanica intricata]
MHQDRLIMLRQIMELEFTAVELNLFLDTHPDSSEALNYFNQISEELRQAKAQYEMNYGPLMNYGFSPSQYPWQWIEEPWPWEIDY